MFKFLTNLDCEAKVLFSHIGVAVNQLGSEIRYADHLAACKTKETKDKIKEKVDNHKAKREEKKNNKKEETKTSKNTETTSKEENKGADINITVDVNYNPKDENEEPEVVVKDVTIKEGDVVIDVDPSELKPVSEEPIQEEPKITIPEEPKNVTPEPEVTIKPDPAHEKNIPLKMGVLYDIDDDRLDESDNKSQKIKERKAQVTPEDVDAAFEKKIEEARKQNKKK